MKNWSTLQTVLITITASVIASVLASIVFNTIWIKLEKHATKLVGEDGN